MISQDISSGFCFSVAYKNLLSVRTLSWWIIIKKSAFWKERSVKDTNSYLSPHFPASVKPSFLSKLQPPPKECPCGLTFRVYETLGIKPLFNLQYSYTELHDVYSHEVLSNRSCGDLTASFFVCFFVSLMIVFSPNNCLFGTIDSVSHCHGFAGK